VVYDITTSTFDTVSYRAVVDQLDVASIDLASPRGGALYVGHPTQLSASIDVLAQPFEGSIWYGLETDDGAHCIVGKAAVSHLPGYFDDAVRANQAAAQKANAEVPTPSLSSCDDDGAACADGESCLQFREDAPLEAPPSTVADPADESPPEELSPEPEHVDAPTTVIVSRCATTDWAEQAVTRAHHHLQGLTPGDLAGSQRAQHTLDERTLLPEACGALVGKRGLTVWLAFDPEDTTDFAMRPAASTDTSEDERGFASRLPASEVPAHVAVQPDPGLDIELESVTLAGSVLEVRADDPIGGDFTADTLLSVDGAATPQQAASATSATVSYAATLRPLGDARPGCAAGTTAPEALEIVSLDAGGTPAYATTSTVKLHGAHVESSHALPLHYPAALRAKLVTGDWACWDDFAVDVCFTTSVQQNSAPDEGTADDCATTSMKIVRTLADDGPVADPTPTAASKVFLDFVNGCDEKKFQNYVDLVKKWRNLENTVQVTDTRIYDYGKWLQATIWHSPFHGGAGWQDVFSEGGGRRAGYQQYLSGCVNESIANGAPDWSNWFCKYAPWNLNYNDYKNVLIPYFWNNFKLISTDPVAATRNGFAFECAGIANGSVCSAINYDPARVGELAARIRKLLEKPWDASDPLNALMSPNERHRCLARGLYSLVPYKVAADGTVTTSTDPADYDRFYTDYLAQVCEKGRYKAEADKAWADIAASCTYVSKPFADSGTGVYADRLVPELYKSYESGTLGGLKAVVEGGIVNDYIINANVGQFVLTFGPQARVYLDADPSHQIAGNFAVKDIFNAWMQGRFFSDVVSSQATAGFHVLTHDIWKISFPIPAAEFAYPNPPELAKEKKKCKYIWKPPMPVRIELCGGIGGKVALDVNAKIFKRGVTDTNGSGRPGVSGTVTPRVAITTLGSAGVDYWVGVAGLEISLDPTLGIALPITTSAKWDLKLGTPTERRLTWALEPGIRADLQLQALGGSVEGFNRLRFGSKAESRYEIFAWDPLELASWNLVDKSHVLSGSKAY
jgi:hypothetical protein